MPKLLNGTLASSLLFFTAAALQYVQAKEEENANSELQRATETVHNISSAASDKAVPQKVLDGAKCVAVIPRLIVVGGEHGAGVATCKTSSNAWSAPAPFSVSGISWGPQIGARAPTWSCSS